MQYQCPNCSTTLEWSTNNPYRPFCSERCKNKDFIAWANEEHALPGDSNFDDVFSNDLDNVEQ